jgi:hypothetical protein
VGDLGRRLRSLWRALWRSKQLDADMQEEMRFHIRMEAERLRRIDGRDPREAQRQAHLSFGGVEKYKEEGRDARSFDWLDSVSLDARLGVRMLIGHDAWQLRFAGDPGVVGRSVHLGGITHTIVGVMPGGFAFPVNHQFWIPLRLNPLQYKPWHGPDLELFGRLAPGATIEQARAELAAAGRSVADAYPGGADRLRVVARPFTREHIELTDTTVVWLLVIARFMVGALAFVVAVNLAILLYARTVTRLGEIAVIPRRRAA